MPKARRSAASPTTSPPRTSARRSRARAPSSSRTPRWCSRARRARPSSSCWSALRAGSDRPIGVGAFVGEVSFLLGGAPTLGVTATTASVVAEVKHDALQRICVEDPALTGAIFKALAATLAERVHDESVAARVPRARLRAGLRCRAGALERRAPSCATTSGCRRRRARCSRTRPASPRSSASRLRRTARRRPPSSSRRTCASSSSPSASRRASPSNSPMCWRSSEPAGLAAAQKPKQAPRKGPVAAVAGSGSSDTEIIVQARNCSVTLDLAAGCEAFARALEASRLAARAMPPPPPAAAASSRRRSSDARRRSRGYRARRRQGRRTHQT